MNQEIEELLNASYEDYYEFDYFMDVQELTKKLIKEDWAKIISDWSKKSFEWKSRLIESLGYVRKEYIQELTLKALLNDDEPELILSLMHFLPKEAEKSQLYSELLKFSLNHWQNKPEERAKLKLSTWSCGLSKKLLTKLGYKNWKETGLKET